MNRLVSLSLVILASCGFCFAQTPQEAVLKDPQKASGFFYVYDYSDIPDLTPAPQGYSPFYISHFGRHGARYCTSEYDSVEGWFEKASKAGVLTDEGKAFFKRYEAFYERVRYSRGNLTQVGKDQHKAIAEHMFNRFPEVFDGPTHVEAVSTESARVIMSMWSCLSELQALDKDLEISADASVKYASWLQPAHSSNPYLIKGAYGTGKAAEDSVASYFESTVPWKEITGRFFTSPDVLKDVLNTSPKKFFELFYGAVYSTRCLDADRDYFDGLFTQEEAFLIWKGLSAAYFSEVANYEVSESRILDYAAFTLDQIMETADRDMASGDVNLRLRFGHDSGIAPLFAILNVDGCGRATSSLEEGIGIFPNFMIPMGASLQLVFYRNAEGDILVKVLVNEKEASLPIKSYSGPYYRWSDFKAYYQPKVRASERSIKYDAPYTAFKAVDWGWTPVGKSGVEAGGASVKVFGSVQDISLVRFPLKSHTVSIVESGGKDAGITSKLALGNRAVAAINGSYFNMKTFEPATFVKDEGRVLCDRTDDDPKRCNGMFRIQDKKGRIIDILTVDSLSTPGAAKGWREAIVSGPVLMEDGVAVDYPDDGSKYFRNFYARRHPRTLMGYTADGWVYFIVVDGRFPGKGEGMSIDELEVLCESLGLYEAINLDGGGSSTLWTSDQGVRNHPYDNKQFDHEGERTVPNILIVK